MEAVSVTPVSKCGCAHATEYGKQELARVKRAYGLHGKPWAAAMQEMQKSAARKKPPRPSASGRK